MAVPKWNGPVGKPVFNPLGGVPKNFREALFETGLQIAQTVITNYLTNKFSGKETNTPKNKRKRFFKTFGNKYPYYRKRKRSYRNRYAYSRSRRKKYYR